MIVPALNSIYQSSVDDFLLRIPKGSVDLVIADPPYFDIVEHEFDRQWSDVGDYIEWSMYWLHGLHRVLKPTSSVYLWGAIGYNRGYALPKICNLIEQRQLFKVRNWITQRNTRGFGNKKGYVCAREELVFMTVSDEYTWNNAYLAEPSIRKDLGANGKPRKNKFKRATDVWCDITEAAQSSNQRFHYRDGSSFPTVKSLDLCRRIIEASSDPGDIVFVPFAGSGSECVSARMLGRHFYACDKDEQAVEIAEKRLGEWR